MDEELPSKSTLSSRVIEFPLFLRKKPNKSEVGKSQRKRDVVIVPSPESTRSKLSYEAKREKFKVEHRKPQSDENRASSSLPSRPTKQHPKPFQAYIEEVKNELTDCEIARSSTSGFRPPSEPIEDRNQQVRKHL